MRLRTIVLVILILSFAASFVFAEETPQAPPSAAATKVAGANNFGSETLDSLQGAGLVKMYGTTVVNLVQVSGSLITKNAQIGSLEITGEANLTGTTVHGGGNVAGSLQMVSSTFNQSLTLTSQKAVFTASHLEGIKVLQDMGYKGKQILELRKGTIVNGPIEFQSGKGEVQVFPGSLVLGEVTGGKIVKKSN